MPFFHRPARLRRMPALLLAALLPAAGALADDRPAVVVTDPTATAYRVALQRFAPGPGEADRVEVLHKDVAAALAFSGLFTVLDDAAFLGPVATGSFDDRVVCSDWSQIRADALVQGEVRREGGKLVFEYRVIDVARACRSLRRHRYRANPADARTLARRVADDVVAAFTGRGGVSSTEIAFVSNRTGTPEIHVMDAMGGNERAITKSGAINQFPSWHPRGDEIVYTSYRDGGRPHIFVLARVGRSGRILRNLDPAQSHYRAVFEPGSGSRLALVAKEGPAAEIFLVGRSGRPLTRLTQNRNIDVSPTWSPDGEKIAFVSDRSGSPQVYVMTRDGVGVRRITFNGGYNTAPSWSPDGRWIAYEARVGGQFDIWLVDPEEGTNVPLVSHPRSDEGPSWSPDGRKVVFSSSRRGSHDLYRVDVSGQNLVRLTSSPGDEKSPAWGPYPR